MMKLSEFKHLLRCCVTKYNLDPANTPTVVKWNPHEYHPVYFTDIANPDDNTVLIICSQDEKVKCSTLGGDTLADFYIFSNASRRSQVVHNMLTVEDLLNLNDSQQFVSFMITSNNLPVNVRVDINPWKTECLKTYERGNIISFHTDDRDDGERPDDNLVDIESLPGIGQKV